MYILDSGALDSNPSELTDGFAEVGMLIVGFWPKCWIQAAAAMSIMDLFEAENASDAFQLLGMSEMGMLPSIFASRFDRFPIDSLHFVLHF
ncbi:hypothetical protein K7X08_036851 [Anisodus acutangulus]|uniref:Uncharacterized protein n=1 Tax=Anisodus acutangulus TaxID=402998 RepID=A0A9Q1L9H2_9SOLA|nr:hypothetical protein K7X08_036851 [Anisodus acutangulus]